MSEHMLMVYAMYKIFDLLKYRSGVTVVQITRLNLCAAVMKWTKLDHR